MYDVGRLDGAINILRENGIAQVEHGDVVVELLRENGTIKTSRS
jgi:hypothetical protein